MDRSSASGSVVGTAWVYDYDPQQGIETGGHWDYTMHGPDGVDYPNNTKYFEVEECKKLVYDHGGHADRPPLFRVTVLFSEANGKTTMEMCMTLPTPEAAEQTRKFIKEAGGNATWDRLAEYLAKGSSGKEKFVINRSFDAPIEKMFEMWTNPDHITKWLPPTGFEMQYMRADIKSGGDAFFCMTANDGGMKMYGRAHYLEINKPNRLVYTQQFCDENEKLSRHPGAPTWPDTMLTTVVLAAEGPDQTRVTVTSECDGDTMPEELAAFIKERGGMTKGWTRSFDKLEDHLANR